MLQEIYPYFIKFHIFFSVAFLLVACLITVHSLIGWIKSKQYGNFENKLRVSFIYLLIIDLVLGIVLYFFLQKPYEIITAEQALRLSDLRFWAIQHFSNMMFVIILCIIGNIFIQKTTLDHKKFKYSFLYFGISTLIIIISVGLFAIRK